MITECCIQNGIVTMNIKDDSGAKEISMNLGGNTREIEEFVSIVAGAKRQRASDSLSRPKSDKPTPLHGLRPLSKPSMAPNVQRHFDMIQKHNKTPNHYSSLESSTQALGEQLSRQQRQADAKEASEGKAPIRILPPSFQPRPHNVRSSVDEILESIGTTKDSSTSKTSSSTHSRPTQGWQSKQSVSTSSTANRSINASSSRSEPASQKDTTTGNLSIHSYFDKSSAVPSSAQSSSIASRTTSLLEPALPTTFGLRNTGNSCYINATLQALLSLWSFTADLGAQSLFDSVSDSVPLKSLYRALLALLDQTLKHKRTRTLDPSRLKLAVAYYSPLFRNNMQQDAHEFLVSCFNQLESELMPGLNRMRDKQIAELRKAKKNAKAPLQDPFSERKTMLCPSKRNFVGVIRGRFTCCLCHESSYKTESFRCLTLDVFKTTEQMVDHYISNLKGNGDTNSFGIDDEPGLRDRLEMEFTIPPTLDALFKLYFCPEKVERKCEKCPGTECHIRREIVQLPRILIIHLKRFSFDYATETFSKLDFPISMSTEFDITKYCENSMVSGPIPYDHAPSSMLENSLQRFKGLEKEEMELLDVVKRVREDKKRKRNTFATTSSSIEIGSKLSSLSSTSDIKGLETSQFKTGNVKTSTRETKSTLLFTSSPPSSPLRGSSESESRNQAQSKSDVKSKVHSMRLQASFDDSDDEDGAPVKKKRKEAKFGASVADDDSGYSTDGATIELDIRMDTRETPASPLTQNLDSLPEAFEDEIPRYMDLPSAYIPPQDLGNFGNGGANDNAGLATSGTKGKGVLKGGSVRGVLKGGAPPKIQKAPNNRILTEDTDSEEDSGSYKKSRKAEIEAQPNSLDIAIDERDENNENNENFRVNTGALSSINGEKGENRIFDFDSPDLLDEAFGPKEPKESPFDCEPIDLASLPENSREMWTAAVNALESETSDPYLWRQGFISPPLPLLKLPRIQDDIEDFPDTPPKAQSAKPSAPLPPKQVPSSTSSLISIDDEGDELLQAMAASVQDQKDLERKKEEHDRAVDALLRSTSTEVHSFDVRGLFDSEDEKQEEYRRNEHEGDEIAPEISYISPNASANEPIDRKSVCQDPPRPPLSFNYQLRAVVHHIGTSVNSGHYVADIRTDGTLFDSETPSTSKKENVNGNTSTHSSSEEPVWHHFDDERVSSTTEEAVLRQKTSPYLLFFVNNSIHCTN